MAEKKKKIFQFKDNANKIKKATQIQNKIDLITTNILEETKKNVTTIVQQKITDLPKKLYNILPKKLTVQHYFWASHTKNPRIHLICHRKNANFGSHYGFQSKDFYVNTKKSEMVDSFVLTHTAQDQCHLLQNIHNPLEPIFIPEDLTYIWCSHPVTPQDVDNIKAQIRTYLKFTRQQQEEFYNSCSEIRRIKLWDCMNNRCDLELIGHNGVFATKDLPKNTILGHYSGLYIQNLDEMKLIYEKYDKQGVHAYLFRFMKHQEWPRISAYKVGNRICVINCASNYAFGKKVSDKQLDKRLNTIAIYAKSTNNPNPEILHNPEYADMIYYATLRDVLKGEQLLVDYGSQYWK